MTALAIFKYSAAWVMDCQNYRGRLLIGRFGHWCPEWDELPIDETCPEWPCTCADELQRAEAAEAEDGRLCGE